MFGEQGLLEKQQRSATVTATDTLRVIKIEHWELSRMKKSMPEVVDQLLQRVEERSGSRPACPAGSAGIDCAATYGRWSREVR